MTTVAISQPMYFPWPGFMEMMKISDVFVWLDDAQFSKGSFTNRVQLMTASGRKWMTVPLEGKGAFREIRALRPANDHWREAHRGLLSRALSEAPCQNDALAVYDAVMEQSGLWQVLIASAEEQARVLDAMPETRLLASQMDVPGASWQRVIDIVLQVGGTHYVSGAGGARYLDHSAFERAGIHVSYMEYNPAPWPQAHGEFTPFVTSLDLIASCGKTAARHLRPNTVSWRKQLSKVADANDANN